MEKCFRPLSCRLTTVRGTSPVHTMFCFLYPLLGFPSFPFPLWVDFHFLGED